MKKHVENSLNQLSGKKDDVALIAVMIDPVSFEAQIHDQECMNVTVAEDSLR